MKLFIKEHRLLIVVQIIQLILIIFLFWLDGYTNIKLALYSLLISLFFLFCYLVYRYVSHRAFYKRLSEPLSTLEESLQHLEQSPLPNALNNLLKTQYQHYKYDVLKAERKQEEHLIFMDRWIHQMKTPLSVLELMAKDLDEPLSSSFREEIDRMKTGLQMVLYMARLRMIEQDFHIKKVSLPKLVQEVNQENKRNFIRNEIYPKIIEKETDLTVETDEKWLFFIVSQLLNNAVKYSAGQAKEINITLTKRYGHVILEITDHGIGIPKEDLKRIFDAFYTGENGRKFRESTGVGLYLVNEVINYLGHSIEVESLVGEGSTFRIIFS